MPDINRLTAYYIISDVETRSAYSNIATNHRISDNEPDSPGFVRELAYGVLRYKLYLDYMISSYVKTPVEKLDLPVKTLLRMCIYQIIYMDSVPDYAAVYETVTMAKRFARGRDAFINGVMRQFLRDKGRVELPDRKVDLTKHLSVKYSYEPWIVDMLLGRFGDDAAESLLSYGNMIPPVCIRVNTIKTDGISLMKELRERGFDVTEGMAGGRSLHLSGHAVLKDILYRDGMFSIQDDGAIEVVRILGARPGETVMDICAAPGGKTGAIAEDMQNRGRIIAIDIYQNRIKLIDRQMHRLGIKIVDTLNHDAKLPLTRYFEIADRVLVDAPCTGLGTVRHKPEIKYRPWDKSLEELPGKQLDILKTASGYVKRGGTLVYSTCTIVKRENEDVIAGFLAHRPDFMLEEMKQLLPDRDGTDGFFICKMRREGVI